MCANSCCSFVCAHQPKHLLTHTQTDTHTHAHIYSRALTHTHKQTPDRETVSQTRLPPPAGEPRCTTHTDSRLACMCVCVCVCTYFLFGFLDIFMAKLVLCRLCWRCELRAVAVAVAVLLLRKPAPKSVSVCSAAQPRTWLLCLSFYTQVNNDLSKSAINSLTLASSTSTSFAAALLATQTAKVCPLLMTSVGNFFNLNKRKRTFRIYIQICT